MTTSEKVAYLKGLAEGMGIQEDGGQGKLFHVIIDILEDLSLDLADTKDALVDLTDGVEEINEDLAELENEFYESPCSCCGGDDEDEEYDDEDEDDDEDDDDAYDFTDDDGEDFDYDEDDKLWKITCMNPYVVFT